MVLGYLSYMKSWIPSGHGVVGCRRPADRWADSPISRRVQSSLRTEGGRALLRVGGWLRFRRQSRPRGRVWRSLINIPGGASTLLLSLRTAS